VDSCDPISGIANVATDSLCSDSNVCTGVETCDAVNDCQAGTPLVVDDGNACTADSCDPISGVLNAPLDPDDGVSCTVDSCDPITGIANMPNDGLCDDGVFCTGTETCDAILDCQAGTPPASCESPFTVLANSLYDNKDGKDYFGGGPDGSEPFDDLRTPAEERKVEILPDDPSFYWEARYEDLAGGTVSGVEVLVNLRRENAGSGDVQVQVWSGGVMLAVETVPMSSIVAKGRDHKLPPTPVLVAVPIDGLAASVVNDMTVLLYVSQPNSGKKVWWSYTEVRGTGP